MAGSDVKGGERINEETKINDGKIFLTRLVKSIVVESRIIANKFAQVSSSIIFYKYDV